MARRFASTTTGQAGITSGWPIITLPFSMACRVRTSDVTTFQVPLQFRDGPTTNVAEIFIQSGLASLYASNGTVSPVVAPVATLTINQYSNIVITFTSASRRDIYLNGTTGNNTASETTTCTWGTFPTQFYLAPGALTPDIDLADVAVWNVALAVQDVAQYMAGVSALLIRPSALKWQNELFGRGNPEPSLVSGLSYTVGNAAIVDEPPIFRPRRIGVVVPPAAHVRLPLPPFFQMVS